MRISDWSSDVCSSDLLVGDRDERLDVARLAVALQIGVSARQRPRRPGHIGMIALRPLVDMAKAVPRPDRPDQESEQIGRASGRERGCKYVEIPGVVGSLKKKQQQANNKRNRKQ